MVGSELSYECQLQVNPIVEYIAQRNMFKTAVSLSEMQVIRFLCLSLVESSFTHKHFFKTGRLKV